jgi:D-alanyl-D-alanine carboxypeptidase
VRREPPRSGGVVVGREASLRGQLDRLAQQGRVPGLQYVVVSAEGEVFAHVAGLADIAGVRPLEAGTSMMAYSMSKTLTAAAVLQLVEAGQVRLDDPIARYLPAQPYGDAITIRQLLCHTAGIPNPLPLRWVHPAAAHASFDEHAELRAILGAHPRRTAPPGARFHYSNIGYWLLGPLVEAVSGEAFPHYMRTNVLLPLDAGAGGFGYDVPDPEAHAKGYLERYSALNLLKGFLIAPELIGRNEERWVHIRSHFVNGAAFGGLVGTASAFGRFLQDQLRPRSAILGEQARRLFVEPQRVARGAAIPMTLGWHIREHAGMPCLFKEGGGGGFHSMMRLYPSRGIGTVVLTNATGFDVSGLLDRLDPRFF